MTLLISCPAKLLEPEQERTLINRAGPRNRTSCFDEASCKTEKSLSAIPAKAMRFQLWSLLGRWRQRPTFCVPSGGMRHDLLLRELGSATPDPERQGLLGLDVAYGRKAELRFLGDLLVSGRLSYFDDAVGMIKHEVFEEMVLEETSPLLVPIK